MCEQEVRTLFHFYAISCQRVACASGMSTSTTGSASLLTLRGAGTTRERMLPSCMDIAYREQSEVERETVMQPSLEDARCEPDDGARARFARSPQLVFCKWSILPRACTSKLPMSLSP